MRQIPRGLTTVGFQSISIANSTAVGVNSTIQNARYLRISITGTNARYRDDAAPTVNTGVVLPVNSVHVFDRYDGTSLLKFHRSAAGTLKVDIAGYKYQGSS